MKRQNVRKPAAKAGSRPHPRKAQRGLSESIELSKDDDMAPNQSLLVTTSRRIGSVLGKIVATTEKSFARKGPKLSPKKRTSAPRSRKASVKRGTPKAS